jgi:hypothetical protein
MGWAGMWRVWESVEILAGFGEETWMKEPPKTPRRRWENGINIDFKEM